MTPTPETGTARIRWDDEPGETLGYVGTFDSPAFRIWPPDAEGDRVLLVYLVGAAQHMYHGDTADGLKAKAEQLLTEFVSSLGAIFPEKRICPTCYGSGTDSTVNRNDCRTCKGTGDVLRVPGEPAKETGQ